MSALLGYTPDQLMATPEWREMSPEDRSYVVDQWAVQHKAASPAATPDEFKEFNGMVDSFRQAAAPSMSERTGSFLGGVAESIPRSVAAAAITLPSYAAEAGGSIGNAIAGASGGEFLRQAPLTTRTVLSVAPTLQNLGNWSQRQMGGQKAKAFGLMNQKLEALRANLLDGDNDPRAVKSMAAQVAVAAAGYHGDDATGYLYAGAPDGLADPNSFADLVKEERRPKVINSTGTRDADLSGTRTIHADPENLALAAAFRETRNPAYFEELSKRLTMSDAEMRKASLTYANAVPDQAEYEKAWGDLAPLKYVRGALYGQADSPVDAALSLSGVGGLFRGAKAAAAGGLTLSKIGRGALKSTAVEGASGAASAIGADARVTGGEIAEQAAAEVLGEAGGAAGTYVAGRGLKALVGQPAAPTYNAPESAPVETPLPEVPEPPPATPPFTPDEPSIDPGTAAAGLDLPTGPGEIDPSLLPDVSGSADLTPPTPQDPVGTVPETPAALAEQKRRVARGNQAGMIVPGATAASLPVDLQPDESDSLVVTDTPDGAVIHALDVSREEVLAAQANGTLMETLGYATSQKPSTPDAVAVTVRTADGTEVSAELAAPEDVPAAIEAAAAKADPTDIVAIEEPADVVEDRMAPPPDLVPPAPSLEEAMATAPPIASPAKLKRQTKAQKAEAAANAKFLEAQAKAQKRSLQARRGAGIPDHPLGAVDILDHVQEIGKIYLPPPNKRRGGDQDDVVSMAKRLPPRYMAIFSKQSGDSVDTVAQELYRRGHLKDPYPSTLVDAIQEAYEGRVSARKQAAQMEQEEKQVVKQAQAFQEQVVSPKPSTMGDRTAVDGQDLHVGDELTVGDHKIKVIDLDPDTGDITLEDGAKFGIQRIGESTVLYVEDHDSKGPGAALDAWDLDMEPEPMALETQTPEDVEADRQAEASRAQQQSQAQEIERRRTAPLTGDSSNVGQGALFEEDADLFSGPSAQSRQAGIEAWADRTIAEGRKRLNSGLDPELAAAYAVKGAAIVARGIRDFATWSREMVKEFGESIRPHLQRIFDQSTGATESDLASVAAAGPTVQSLPPGYDINRFGIRMQADERLRASWRARFSPALYKTFTEEGLARDVRQWIADNGGLPGATSLFLDDASGLQDFERNALGQQLAIAWDLRAVRMERQGNTEGVHQAEAALESVSAKLETLATQAGQALRAFGLWSKLSPRGLVRATQRRVDAAREDSVTDILGVTPDQAVQALEQGVAPQPQDNEILTLWNMMQADGPTARGRSISATLKAIMPQVRDWRRTIDQQFAQAGFREQMTSAGAERLVRNYFQMLAPARAQAGPLASFDAATQELLSQTLREAAVRAGIVTETISQQPDAVEKIVLALSNDPLRMDKLQAADALMQQELADRPDLRGAWEDATAAMASQIAGPAMLRRALRQELQRTRPAWREAFNTGQPLSQAASGIRKATVAAVMNQVRQRIGIPVNPDAAVMLPALEAELTAAFDTIAAERYAQWQGQQEQAAARARVAEARRRFLAALKPGNMTQQRIDQLDAIMQADAMGSVDPEASPNPLTELLGKHLKEPVPDFVAQAQALGVPREIAADFDQAVIYHRDKAERTAKERAIQSLIKSLGPKTPKAVAAKVPRVVSSWMKATKLGATSRSAFLDAWAKAFDLPRLTPELAAELRAMVSAVDAAPLGSWIRQREMSRLMSRLSLHEGMKSSDILTAYWYANILSGIGTQLVNISGNASHLFLKSVQQILTHHPREILPFLQGMLDGAAQGAAQGWMAFKDGDPVLRNEEKWGRSDVLEILWSDKPKTLGRLIAKYGAASWGRYVFRGLTAMDAMFYTTSKEGRAWVDVSRSLAKGQSLEQALGYDTASWTAAQQQAAADLAAAGQKMPSTREVDRRAHEILEARRSADVLASSRRFGAETTFNYEPEGTLGGIAQLINRFIVMAPPFRLVVPFTKIVANLTDKALDWTPYGLVRAGLGRHTFNHQGRRFSTQERQERLVSGALSLAGGAALYALAKSNEDQDDETVPFMIYGMGPRDTARRAQMPDGWRPMTIKVGNKYISYAETPLNLLLGAIGGAMDLRRYGKRKDSDEPMARAAALMGGMTNGILRSGMLSGLSQLIDAARGQGKWSSFGLRSASGLIPMQGLMRNLAEVIDPVKMDTESFSGAMLQNIPILRGEGQVKLNAFGEPVRTPGPWLISRLVTFNERPDPDAVWLGRNKLSLPGYDNDIVVGTYLSPDDKARLKATGGGLEADRLKRAENMARVENGYLTDEERTAFIRRAGALQRQAVRQLRTQTEGRQVDPKALKRQLESNLSAARRIAMRQQMGLAPK